MAKDKELATALSSPRAAVTAEPVQGGPMEDAAELAELRATVAELEATLEKEKASAHTAIAAATNSGLCGYVSQAYTNHRA